MRKPSRCGGVGSALYAVADYCCLQWLKESNFVSLLLDTFDTDNDMVR